MPPEKKYYARKAAQEAKYKSKILERLFSWWRNPPDRFGGLVAIFTAMLFAATVGLWIATADLVEDATESGRAWVTPNYLHLEKPLKIDEEASLLLYYSNTGKEPALKLGIHNEAISIPIDKEFFQPSTEAMRALEQHIKKLDLPDSCKIADTSRFAGIVYPSTLTTYSNAVTVASKWMTQQIVDGFGFIVVEGCLVYETVKKTRFSRYCFFYNGKIAQMRPIAHRDYWQSCPTGNDAK